MMQYCNYCQVHIRGNKKKCPLCKNVLSKEGNEQEEICPLIPPTYQGHLALKIMIFITIVSIVLSFAIYRIFPMDINWPIFVVFGLLSMWLSLIVVIRKRHNIPKTVLWQVTIVSILSIFWDFETDWRGWSLNYVIPITCVLAMFVMYITVKIMKISIRNYILYFILDGLFGIVPILFIIFGWIDVFYPSIICVSVSIIFLSAIIIFQGENIKRELDRRMHI